MSILGVIPARLKSERFPNKLLAELNGKSIIERVIKNAKQFNVDKLIIATDSNELIDYISNKKLNIEIFYMEKKVCCGSERIKYVYNKYPGYNYYMSIPADEPLVDPTQVNFQLSSFQHNKSDIFTFFSRFYSAEHLQRTQSCKIVCNKNGQALYFSRAVIPTLKNGGIIKNLDFYKKHIGIFIFSNAILHNNLWAVSELASIEGLEQNMFLDNGYKIQLLEIKHLYYGVDTQNQIKELEDKLNDNNK